mmetsp:Transcript_16727/g.25398  ORF Transcript_16727/g.25398 Transcript_16727/m.25398 type:complete len:277 (-) Transcript_16727:24-854(-)
MFSVKEEEDTVDNTNNNFTHCINALPPRHQEVFKNVLGGGEEGLEDGFLTAASAWDTLFKSDESTRKEYLEDISRLDGNESDSATVLASFMRSKATLESCFPNRHSAMDFLYLLQVACNEHADQVSIIFSDSIPSFFKTARMDTDLLGKYAIQIPDIVAFKLVLKLVWGHGDMKKFRRDYEKKGFIVGCFDNRCYLSHPNMHDSDLGKLDLVVSKHLGELNAMTRERDEWKKRCKEYEAKCDVLEEQLRRCRSQLDDMEMVDMPMPELPPINTEAV